MLYNGFVAGGHECIVALRGYFDSVAQGRKDETLLQIFFISSLPLAYLPASEFIRWIPGYPW
jgi:hypothetical protein